MDDLTKVIVKYVLYNLLTHFKDDLVERLSEQRSFQIPKHYRSKQTPNKSVVSWPICNKQIDAIIDWQNGSGTVGKAATSDTRDPLFTSSYG